MKPHRFSAPTARAALAKVREALGADAVILANRATPSGVEVLAVCENDLAPVVARSAATTPPAGPAGAAVRSSLASPGTIASEAAARMHGARTSAAGPADRFTAAPASEPARARAAPEPQRLVDIAPRLERSATVARDAGASARGGAFRFDDLMRSAASGEETLAHESMRGITSPPGRTDASSGGTAASAGQEARLLAEIDLLRRSFEERIDALAATGEMGLRPIAVMLRRELLGAGFQGTLVRSLLDALPNEYSARQARDWLDAKLHAMLACAAPNEDLADAGGVFALTGPTGVGKTTTAAKLAARCVVRYGSTSVGLVTTDTYRIGAPDQLRIYGKILGVPVHTVHDVPSLESTLTMLSNRRLVLIDTIGLGQRDARVQENLDTLDEMGVARLLVVSAPTQPETLDDVIAQYRGSGSVGCILTKIDEAMCLAPSLSVLMSRQLKLRYVTNGQRVPEDLHAADAGELLRSALATSGPAQLAMSEAMRQRAPAGARRARA